MSNVTTSYRKSLDFILVRITDFIATCHVRKANGKIPFPTHTVVQAAAVTGCDGVRDAPFL